MARATLETRAHARRPSTDPRWTSRIAALAAAVVAIGAAACSGSSDAGFGSTLTVEPTQLAFHAYQGGAAPAAQEVQISFSSREAQYLGTSFRDSAPGWASVGALGSGDRRTLLVGVTQTSLPAGTYTATLVVALLRADRSVIVSRDVQLTYRIDAALSATPATLAFQYVRGGSLPGAQDVSVAAAGVDWTATASRPWIATSAASGTGSATIQVTVDPTGLAAGSYDGTVTFARPDGGPSETVSVSFVVEDPRIVETPAALSFSGVNGAAIAAQTVHLSVTTGAAVTWSAAVTSGARADWITLSPAAGSTPGDLVVSVDPSRAPLQSGTYATTITVTATVTDGTSDVPLSTVIPVSLSLTAPTLAAGPSPIALGGTGGRDLSPRQVQLTLGTGAAAYGWTATASAPWIAVSPSSGSASATASTIAVSADASTLAAGTYEGGVTFSATVNGDVVTATVPVTLTLDERRLLASDDGVALATMPGLARLSRTLRVRDNFGVPATWTATTSAAWLTATAGAQPDELVVAADPSGLAADALYEATVTLTPDASSIAPETVRVGLWVGATTPPASRSVAGAFQIVVMDPVRPYAYVHQGGTDVQVYNVFTGALVTTFARVVPSLGNMDVSTDGARLFVVDQTNLKVVPIDLPGGTKGTGWTIPYVPETIVYARTNGRGLVFPGGSRAIDVATGAQLDATPLYLSSAAVADAAVDGSRLCWASTGASGHDVVCHALDYSAAEGKLLVGAARLGYTDGYNGDLAVSDDGSRVFHQDGIWDTATMARAQTISPRGRAFALTHDGRSVIASFGVYEPADIRVRDADGFVLASYKVAGYAKSVLDAQLEVTGDGLCAAAITDDPKLVFLIVAP